ncbi:MAG TPA: imidazole glycerol phosphate synthase subunit HisH, partial [Devosia sp.]|nr:imidazole glycerol phosphate synthase subunit HisH [Devosia sp.]
VLPGVGAFADCRAGLHAIEGMVDTLNERVRKQAVPFFGICVGMQLMADAGLEKGTHAGLGWIPGQVTALVPGQDANGRPRIKIPHMGWNNLHILRPHPVLDGLQEDGETAAHAYFVHSYHLQAENAHHVLATTGHGGPVTAIVGRQNMLGTQFHPEKSQKTGLRMIASFLRWKP